MAPRHKRSRRPNNECRATNLPVPKAVCYGASKPHSMPSMCSDGVFCSPMAQHRFPTTSLLLVDGICRLCQLYSLAGNLSGWNSYVRRIRSTKRRTLGRTFSRNVQSIVILVCTVLTAHGQISLQAERDRPQPQAPKWFAPTSPCQILLPRLPVVCHLAVHCRQQLSCPPH